MTTGEDPKELASLIADFLRAGDADRSASLQLVQGRLPSWIRVYDVRGSLAVYHDKVATPLPSDLAFAASYIEAVLPDKSAEVVKSTFGQRKLERTTEPKASTAFDILLEDIEL